MEEVERELDELFAKDEAAFERYKTLIPDSDDISLVILKGHLIIEEILYDLLSVHCVSPDHLEKANLKFSQLMWILRSMLRLPLLDSAWGAISIINKLRNKLAHNIEPEGLEKYITELERLTRPHEPMPEGMERPDTPERIAKAAIYYVLGQLSVISTVSTFIAKRITVDMDKKTEPYKRLQSDAAEPRA